MADLNENSSKIQTLIESDPEENGTPATSDLKDNSSTPPTLSEERTSSSIDSNTSTKEGSELEKSKSQVAEGSANSQNVDSKDSEIAGPSENTENDVIIDTVNQVNTDASAQVEKTIEDSKQEIPVDLNSVPPSGVHDSDNLVKGACGSSDSISNPNGGDKKGGNGESIHQIKWVYFKKKQVPVITQNENGPCPLLALINVLLLQNRIKLTPLSEIVSASQLMEHLGDCVLQNVPGEDGVSTPSRLNFEQNMGDAMAVMYKLQTGLDVNVKFTGVRDFEYTSECIIFDLLQIALYHGWLVDPQNSAEVEAVGKYSYNQLVEKIIGQKSSEEPDLVSQALVAEQFLESSASQLTYHGLSELCTQLKEDELAVLFRNNHFTTLYRYKGELFQLVTDQGFLHESNVVWETLSNVEGDCHFVDSEFRTYRKPEPPPLSTEPPAVPINTEAQIDHDYMMALSLQQEQQPSVPSAWQPANVQLTDEELAKQLQEEERRAAMQEQGGEQRGQGQVPRQQAGAQQSSLPRRHNRPSNSSGQHRDDKKSDCCIL